MTDRKMKTSYVACRAVDTIVDEFTGWYGNTLTPEFKANGRSECSG